MSPLEDKNSFFMRCNCILSYLIGKKHARCSPAFPAIKPCRSVTLQEAAAFTKTLFTQRHHQEAHVIEPVGRLVGELGDEELQDGSQVALAAHRRHLHRSGHGRVTVTAAGTRKEREREIHVIKSGTSSITETRKQMTPCTDLPPVPLQRNSTFRTCKSGKFKEFFVI